MRLLVAVVLPLAVQLLGFLIVIKLSRGSGSLVYLLAVGLAVLAVPMTTVVNWARARRVPASPAARLLTTGLAFALTWPLLLLVLRAIESSI
jgi:hypothetical protein